MVTLSSLLGRISTRDNGGSRREEESSDEGMRTEIGVKQEWFLLFPQRRRDLAYDILENYGPLIMYTCGMLLHEGIVNDCSGAAEMINSFVSALLNCIKSMNEDISLLQNIMKCLPTILLIEEHSAMLISGTLTSKVVI
jgi:hypothetical protein